MGGLPGGRSVPHTTAIIQRRVKREREEEKRDIGSMIVILVNTSQRVSIVGSMESRPFAWTTALLDMVAKGLP